MFKKLDRYIIKTFLSPFVLIFSVLFFIFIMNIVWIQLSQFTGKGLSYYEILKLLFYMGVSVVSMVLPLTILLSSIMTFGELGERYELVAMKAAGIPLYRIMQPLFFIVSLLAVILFVFSNNITPDFQRKAKNMLYNIAATKPALNFSPGQFIDQIPGYAVKFDRMYGENGENIEGVFIHKIASSFDNQQAIVAKKGRFSQAVDRNYLKLTLYDGYIFEDDIKNKDYNQRLRQPNQAIKFDTMVSHFDISELINKAIESERITDDYRFHTYGELNHTIENMKKDNASSFIPIKDEIVMQTNNYVAYIDKNKLPKKATAVTPLDSIKKDEQLEVLFSAYNKIEGIKNTLKSHEGEVLGTLKNYNKVIMYQQRIVAFSFTCIIFFLIGSSLGSIVRKGGFGLPVIIAIGVFIIFYVMNITVENFAWKDKIDPYLAAWIPNIILLPFGVWLTYKALTDSQLMDIEKYRRLLKPFTDKISKAKEHQRYQ